MSRYISGNLERGIPRNRDPFSEPVRPDWAVILHLLYQRDGKWMRGHRLHEEPDNSAWMESMEKLEFFAAIEVDSWASFIQTIDHMDEMGLIEKVRDEEIGNRRSMRCEFLAGSLDRRELDDVTVVLDVRLDDCTLTSSSA